MELDRRPRLFRFSLALVAELLLCASLNFFDDWTLEEMPVKFVTVALLGGIAYFAAVSSFPTQLSAPAQKRIFWGVVIALRLVALPLEPGDDFWQLNAFVGYRFPRRYAELSVGVLNLTDRDYRLNPLTLYAELPRERTAVVTLKINF